MYRWVLLATAWAVLTVAGTPGCGLIDPNITEFNLSLPNRTFTINTEQWNLDSSTSELPAIACSVEADLCGEAIAAYCSGDRCTGTCVDELCQMGVQVSLWRDLDLYSESPELQTIDNQPFVNVTIERVYYEVTENTLNFVTPELSLYVAPRTVMSPADAQARRIGAIAPIPAGSRLGPTDVELTPEGEADLRTFMSDYRTPFNIIIGSQFTVQTGDPMPSGRILTEIGVDARAGL